MVEAVKNNLGQLPERVLSDSGYRSEQGFGGLEEKGVEGLVALGREGKDRTAIDPKRYPALHAWPSGWLPRKVKRTIGGEK